MVPNKCLILLSLLTSAAVAAEIPAGSSLTVRMTDSVDSRSNTVGQLFRAVLDEPIVADGKVVVPRGADVQTKLVEAKEAGRLTGKSELTLALVSITGNGVTYNVGSSEVTSAGKSRTKKTGAVVGGATALGAIIGGIAGGGKGAAIGAVTGAGAGGTYQVLTKGESVRIPTETRLTFTLAHNVELKDDPPAANGSSSK